MMSCMSSYQKFSKKCFFSLIIWSKNLGDPSFKLLLQKSKFFLLFPYYFADCFETLKMTLLPAIKKFSYFVENAKCLKFFTCDSWSLLTFTEYSTSNWCKSRRVIESEEIFYSNTIPGQCYLVHIICNICKIGTKWSEFKVRLN